MSTESFFEDLIIDTPEAAANLITLFESDVRWKRGNSEFIYNDPDIIRRMHEYYCGQRMNGL